MTMTGTDTLTVDEALDAVRDAAWTEHLDRTFEPVRNGSSGLYLHTCGDEQRIYDGEFHVAACDGCTDPATDAAYWRPLFVETTPPGRRRIHTVSARGFGADWDLADAETFIKGSVSREWSPHLLGHDLLVVGGPGPDEGRAIRFETRAPR